MPVSLRTVVLFALSGCGGALAQASVPPARSHFDPDPVSGALEQKYRGQVIFSWTPLAVDGTDDRTLYTTSHNYNAGDPLYVRYFGKEAPQNLETCANQYDDPDPTYRVVIRADVNGEYAGKSPTAIPAIGHYMVNPKVRGASSLISETSLPTAWKLGSVGGNDFVETWFSDVSLKLQERDGNTIRLLVTLDCGESSNDDVVLAEGTLQVNDPNGALNGIVDGLTLPYLERSPHPENAELTPQIIDVVKDRPGWENEHILSAQVTSPEWDPVRNEFGTIVARRINAMIVGEDKNDPYKDKCRDYLMSFERDAAGGALRYASNKGSRPFWCFHLDTK